jgi:hypothetical protein
MNRKSLFIIILTLSFCFYSCNKNKRTNAQKVVSEWTGKEMKFPAGLQCVSIMKDTACIDLYGDNYKILLYIDSLGCTSCRLNLSKWKNLIAEADSVFQKKPEFLFFFQSKKNREKELQVILKSDGFRHPVFIDKTNAIMKLNNIPKEQEYQCFLLGKDNKVVMVGNPVLNPAIWELYKKIIDEKTL